MNPWLDVAALVLATSTSFYFSGIETGIYALNRVRLRLRTEEKDPRARRVTDLLKRPQITISTILIGNHTANYLATIFCMAAITRWFDVEDPALASTLILTPLLFLFGEIVPKDTFRIRAESLVYLWSAPLAFASIVLRPVAEFLFWLGRVSRALPKTGVAPDGMLSRERLADLVGEVAEDGVLTEEQNRMVRNVMRVSSVPVADAMVAAERVDTVPPGFTEKDLVATSARHGHSRLPVRDPETGRFTGVVNVLDLVYRDDGVRTREAPTVPALESVEQALYTLRRARRAMGFVVGEDGGTLGIVTVKDLVEEVSGELPAF
jgi:CBS domain containing-hemolysin-like protein